MAFRIIWAERASTDLLEIFRYLKARDPAAATRIARAIYRETGRLAEFPQAGSALDELDDPAYRKLVFRHWKIVYRVLPEDQDVRIMRIWHAARGPVQLD